MKSKISLTSLLWKLDEMKVAKRANKSDVFKNSNQLFANRTWHFSHQGVNQVFCSCEQFADHKKMCITVGKKIYNFQRLISVCF